MNTDMDILEIDRIVLEGLDVTAVQRNKLRILVEKGLQRRLQENGILSGLSGSETSVLSTSGVTVDVNQSEQLAEGLAQRVVQGIQSMTQPS